MTNNKLKNLTIITPEQSLFTISEIQNWQRAKQLFIFFVKRDLLVRFRYPLIATLWIILQPLLLSIVVSTTVGRVYPQHQYSVPYIFLGFIIWNFFLQTFLRSSNSLLVNQSFITKIALPRIIIPLSIIIRNLLELMVSLIFFSLLLILFKQPVSTAYLLFLLPSLMLSGIFGLSLGILFSVLQIKYRDIREVISFIGYLFFFLTPVIYPTKILHNTIQQFLFFNPVAGSIEMARSSITGSINWSGIATSSLVALIFLISGLIYFQKNEANLADNL